MLRVEGLTKRFAGVVANEDVNFDLKPGEVHCLFGENGAGKSTLSNCIYGLLRPDAGRILVRDEVVELRSPRHALRAGIGMVHQHFVLVPEFTVFENIVVGTSQSGWRLDGKGERKKLEALCAEYGLDIELDKHVWELPVGRQQWVEILKALYLDAQILILDEPTAVLTPAESERLFVIIRKMTERGLSVLLITHKIVEVMKSDRVTVLRKGRTLRTFDTSAVTPDELVREMVGRPVSFPVNKADTPPGDTVLEVKDLNLTGLWGEQVLRNLSLTIARGEILGVAGVAGNGQKELFEILCGAKSANSGSILLNGDQIFGLSPRAIMDRGVGHIPDDRFREGLVGQFSIAENIILGWQRCRRYRRGGWLKRSAIRDVAKSMIAQYKISARNEDAAVERLSGGNAQKVILAREFMNAKSLLLANQPTRGLDVGVIEYVYQQLLQKREEGFAILLASEELSDLFNLADRIVVMFKGEIVGMVDPRTASLEDVGQLMIGRRPLEVAA